ncbi:MAG TPA: hypothetical protein VMF35_01190 [Acidimicrobiales bacterium]|nr:hypothetical protein [Acidimicrobiales bacterium]
MIAESAPAENRDVVEELETALRSHVISVMSDPSGELAAMTTANLLITWFNWRDRLVEPRPRQVHRSRELLASQEAQENAAELAEIEAGIAAGVDLTPWLSSRTSVAYTESAARGRLKHRRDLDLLISNWGIHHLHLERAPERSALLLFTVFRPDDAYLLQLLPHGRWADSSLVEIIIRNWPDESLVMGQLKGAIGLSQSYDDRELLQLREAGVTTLLPVDGGVWVVGTMSTAGTALASTVRSDAIMREIQTWQEKLSSDPYALDVFVRSRGHLVNGCGTWAPYLEDSEFGFVEHSAGLRIRIGRL